MKKNCSKWRKILHAYIVNNTQSNCFASWNSVLFTTTATTTASTPVYTYCILYFSSLIHYLHITFIVCWLYVERASTCERIRWGRLLATHTQINVRVKMVQSGSSAKLYQTQYQMGCFDTLAHKL